MRTAMVTALASMLAFTMAHADTFMRKGGLWHTVTTGVGPTPQTMDLCFSTTTAEQAMARLAQNKDCTKHDFTTSGNVVRFDVVCSMMSMQGVATFNGDSAYHADLTMHMGAGGQARTIQSTSDATWIGPCKAGQKPID